MKNKVVFCVTEKKIINKYRIEMNQLHLKDKVKELNLILSLRIITSLKIRMLVYYMLFDHFSE